MGPRGWDVRTVGFFLLLGLVLAGLVFLYLWQGATLARLRAERAQLALDLEDLTRQKVFLEHLLREAYSPQVLGERARALGMGPVELTRLHYLVIEDGSGD